MHNRAECPICRAALRPEDLFDAATEEEEDTERLLNENMGNYGAKVGGVLARPLQGYTYHWKHGSVF